LIGDLVAGIRRVGGLSGTIGCRSGATSDGAEAEAEAEAEAGAEADGLTPLQRHALSYGGQWR
jgi:hypothetical protein